MVIAIIAVLAALLFPVFAQAKQAAKRSVCLSNSNQLGLAFQMYASDSEETAPTLVKGVSPKYVLDYWQLIQPYLKNGDALFCPEDPFSGCDAAEVLPTTAPKGGCIGYGSNWGPMMPSKTGSEGGGLYGALSYSSTQQLYYAQGISLSSIVSPADMFALGDSDDVPWYSLSMGSITSRYWLYNQTIASVEQTRHAGRFNFNFADGHSKNLLMAGASWTGTTAWPQFGFVLVASVLAPANPDFYRDWCYDPKAMVHTDIGPIECDQIAQNVLSQTTPWKS